MTMGNIHINYEPTGTFSSEGKFVVLKCEHEHYTYEDASDGRVYCDHCDAVGFQCSEQEHEGYDDNGDPEYGTYSWIEWINP